MEFAWQLLIALVLGAHLLAMNVASAGPLIAAAMRLSFRNDSALADACGKRLAWWSLAALGVGAILGVAMALMTWSASMEAGGRFPARAYWFACVELVFSAACMGLIVGRWRRLRPALLVTIASVTSSNLLYHFPPLMAVFGETAANRTWAVEPLIDRPTLLTLMRRGEVLSLWAHFSLASVATAAILAMGIAARCVDDAASEGDQLKRLQTWLARWAFWPTLCQVPVGAWIVVAIGAPSRDALMGGDVVASASLLGGVVAALLLTQGLAYAALGELAEVGYRRLVWLLVIVVLLMTLTLRSSRSRDDSRQVGAPDFVGLAARPTLDSTRRLQPPENRAVPQQRTFPKQEKRSLPERRRPLCNAHGTKPTPCK
ncbi:MAG: hypothetical protein AAF961_12725 [Planctomycetota bacterium]